jgi:hypothetical protein
MYDAVFANGDIIANKGMRKYFAAFFNFYAFANVCKGTYINIIGNLGRRSNITGLLNAF